MTLPDREDAAIQDAGREIIASLFGLARALALYETNNNAVVRVLGSIERTAQTCLQVSGEPIRLQVLAEEFFVNGRLLKVDAQFWERATGLARILSRYKVGEVVFEPGLERSHLEAFAEGLSQSIRSNKNCLCDDGYGSLKLGTSIGRSVASFRFEAHRLARVLYGSLLDLVEQLYEGQAEGRAPSLLPLKRTLQLIIDAMGEQGAMFQVLGAVHDPGRHISEARWRTAAAIDAVGFGQFLSLPRSDRMYLALGAVLGGLSEATDPDEAVACLFRFAGLGEAALPLILAVHDARAARQDRTTGVPGQMLAVAEAYHALTTTSARRKAVSPYRALRAMASGKVEGVREGPARLFAEYKGPYPLGSFVVLDDGSLGLVVALGEGREGKQRPQVALVEGSSRPGRRIDLATHRQRSIARVPEPSDLELNLSLT